MSYTIRCETEEYYGDWVRIDCNGIMVLVADQSSNTEEIANQIGAVLERVTNA